MQIIRRLTLVVGTTALLLGAGLGMGPSTHATEESSKTAEAAAMTLIRGTLEEKFPGMHIRRVVLSEIPGWYVAETDSDGMNSFMYVHEGARYVLSGAMFDIQMGRNITHEYIRDREHKLLLQMDYTKTIVLKPAVERVDKPILVFDDPDCPYCQKLHPEMKKLVAAGVPVAVVLFPLVKPHPDAYRKSVAIWCATDPNGVLDQALTAQPVQSPEVPCQHPIDDNLKLGKKLGISKTPTLFLPSGQRLEGYYTAEQLLAMIHFQEGKP